MFDTLTDKFSGVFRNLSGRGKISEENIRESMKEVHRTRPGQQQRPRRQSLSAFLNLGGGGAKCFVLMGQGIDDLKEMVDNLVLSRMKAQAAAAGIT